MKKFTGIKKAAGIMKNAKHALAYMDTSTGEVWANEYSDGNSWTQYNDKNIICLSVWIRYAQYELGDDASWTAILTWAANEAMSKRNKQEEKKMKKYLFNEICGKKQGEMIIIEANDANEAFEKSRFTEKIKSYERFSTTTNNKMFKCYELDNSRKYIEFICR